MLSLTAMYYPSNLLPERLLVLQFPYAQLQWPVRLHINQILFQAS